MTIKQPSEVTITASFREVFVLFREAASVSAPMLMKAYTYSVSNEVFRVGNRVVDLNDQ